MSRVGSCHWAPLFNHTPRFGAGLSVEREPTPPGGPPTGEWRSLSAAIRSCRRCPLGSVRTHAVTYRGGRAPWIVFVGEAPGVEEDRAGLPFVGRAGAILDRAIDRVGLGPADFGIVNVLKCRPPANRFDPRAARTCRPYLDRQLDLLRPERLVTLGRFALQALRPGALPILRAAGSPLTGEGRPIFPLIHPAATLRARRFADRWERDVGALAGWLADRPRQTP